MARENLLWYAHLLAISNPWLVKFLSVPMFASAILPNTRSNNSTFKPVLYYTLSVCHPKPPSNNCGVFLAVLISRAIWPPIPWVHVLAVRRRVWYWLCWFGKRPTYCYWMNPLII